MASGNTGSTTSNENRLAGELRGKYKRTKDGRIKRVNAKGLVKRKDALGKKRK